ncbi:hypothetical protein ACFL4D_03205, partial [Candidatus Margulisiibacteriota bacterium]
MKQLAILIFALLLCCLGWAQQATTVSAKQPSKIQRTIAQKLTKLALFEKFLDEELSELREKTAYIVSLKKTGKIPRAAALREIENISVKYEAIKALRQKNVIDREKLLRQKTLPAKKNNTVKQAFINKAKIVVTDVRGNTQSSFERSGLALRNLLDHRYAIRYTNGDRLTTLFNGELNTLPRLGEKNMAINRLRAEWKHNIDQITLGGFSRYLSEFSLNQKLRGLIGEFSMANGLSLTPFAGIGNRTWEELADESESTTYRSFVTGLHGKKKVDRNLTVEMAYINSHEYADSASLNVSAKDNMVYSLSFKKRKLYWRNLSLEGEYAGSSYITANIAIADTAYKLKGTWRGKDYKAFVQIKQTGDNYTNVGIPVENDVNELKGAYQVSFWKNTLASKLSYRNYRDNISGQKSTTLITSVPRLDLIYKPYRTLAVYFTKELTNRWTGSNSINDGTDLNRFRIKQQLKDLLILADYRLRSKADRSVSGNADIAQNVVSLTLMGETILGK